MSITRVTATSASARLFRGAVGRLTRVRARLAPWPAVRHVWCGVGIVAVSACSSSASMHTTATSAGASDVSIDARALQMLDLRRADTVVVDALLRDSGAPRRARAALAIGQLRIRSRFDVLHQLLVDADTAVAANAAYALGVAKDTSAVSVLARALAGAPDAVAREAAWALGEIGEPSRAVLTVALGEGSAQPWSRGPLATRSAEVQRAALISTVKLRPIPVALVATWLVAPNVPSARAAAYVIGRSRTSAGVRAMLAIQSSRDAETRSYVARALAKSATGDSLAAAARTALAKLVRDTDAHVRVNAAQSVTTFGALARSEVERALADDDANVRAAAAEGLATVFTRDSAAWRSAWRHDSTFRVRQLLLLGARTAGSGALSSEEHSWSTDARWAYRLASLEARLADDKADRVAIARGAARDADGRVRSAALRALNASVPDADARALLAPALQDPDVEVRAAALALVARRARAEDLDAALAAYSRATKDSADDARVAALRTIAAVWLRDSARVSGIAREQLAVFNAAGSVAERRVVANVTPLAAWSRAGAVVAERPLADYERLIANWVVPGAKQPRAIIRTDHGDITIELFAREAPLVVEAFLKLAASGYYKDTWFHRVVPNFVVQDGDRRGDGSGGAGFTLRESFSRQRHERGAVGLATSGPDTGGSQYYLCLSPQPHLDGAYTVFGRVIGGFDAMDAIVQGDRMLRVEAR